MINMNVIHVFLDMIDEHANEISHEQNSKIESIVLIDNQIQMSTRHNGAQAIDSYE
jgi:hypothetical protein